MSFVCLARGRLLLQDELSEMRFDTAELLDREGPNGAHFPSDNV
jgi:hypothetical protein